MRSVGDEAKQAAEEIVAELRAMRSQKNIAGQRRFGIQTNTEQLGISMPVMRQMAKAYRRRHDMAEALWAMPVQEARMVAAFVEDPAQVTRRQMDQWAKDFDNWALVDQCCTSLFDQIPGERPIVQALKWARQKPEYTRRAGFALMTGLAAHRKEIDDAVFCAFLSVIQRETDGRNFVKKAANLALRRIGQRNATLYDLSMYVAEQMLATGDPAARWIARGAIRELKKKRPAC